MCFCPYFCPSSYLRFISCQVLIPPVAITMTTFPIVTGLTETPVVRRTAAITLRTNRSGIVRADPDPERGWCCQIYGGDRHVCKGDICHIEPSGRYGCVCLCPPLSGTTAPVAAMQRSMMAKEQKTIKRNTGLFFRSVPIQYHACTRLR